MNAVDNGIRSFHPFLQAPIHVGAPVINNATRVNVVYNKPKEDPINKLLGTINPPTVITGSNEWLIATNQHRVGNLQASDRITTKQRYM